MEIRKPTSQTQTGDITVKSRDNLLFFFGFASLCLSPSPTLDPIINMLCLLGIFGYFEYVSGIMDIFLKFLVSGQLPKKTCPKFIYVSLFFQSFFLSF